MMMKKKTMMMMMMRMRMRMMMMLAKSCFYLSLEIPTSGSGGKVPPCRGISASLILTPRRTDGFSRALLFSRGVGCQFTNFGHLEKEHEIHQSSPNHIPMLETLGSLEVTRNHHRLWGTFRWSPQSPVPWEGLPQYVTMRRHLPQHLSQINLSQGPKPLWELCLMIF